MLFVIRGTDFSPSREDFDVPCDEQLKGIRQVQGGAISRPASAGCVWVIFS